jgi:hypothetical protein
MNMHRSTETIDDVLEAYLTAAWEEGPQQLSEWIRRYPQYERELMEFAAARSLVHHLPPAPDADEEEDLLVARGMEVVHELLRRPRSRPVMVDLLAEAKARGLTTKGLAAALGLSVPLVAKLHRRLIRAATIPGKLIEDVARLLEQEASVVARYLGQSPTLAAGANYRAEQAPTLGEQQDFFEAVRTDPVIPETERERWLSLEHGGGGA